VAAFLVDEDVAIGVAAALRAAGHDAVTVDDLGRKGSKDDAVFWIAARLQRVLISHNLADFVLLHRAWLRWNIPQRHAGILLPRQTVAFRADDVARAVLQLTRIGMTTAQELYTLERDWNWRRFNAEAAIADTTRV
jgi:predicted nuclease of predicted toxin-antitoxin system